MLCRACLKLFNVYQRRLVELNSNGALDQYGGIPHQISEQDVEKSSQSGCDPCRRLMEKRVPAVQKPTSSVPVSTCCIFNPVFDKLDVQRRAFDDFDPPQETPKASGLQYRLHFWWKENDSYIPYQFCKTSSYTETIDITYRLIAKEKFSKLLDGYVPSRHTNSLSTWTLIKKWLRNCEDNHGGCSPRSGSEFIPTRLLDVGTKGDGTRVCLVLSKELPGQVKYMTLSHCWGNSKVLELGNENMEQMKAGIPMETLPKLYQDAVVSSRKLGVRYLWIDSLCIIQGPDEVAQDDWLYEATRMGDVYINSYCNLAPMDASDSRGSFFHKRDTKLLQICSVEVEWLNKSFYVVDERNLVPLQKTLLGDRAWVLQEQLLAPRIVLFTKDQVLWECRTCEASEIFTAGLPERREGSALSMNSMQRPPISSLKRAMADHIQNPHSWNVSPMQAFWRHWKAIVEDYTRRSMSFEKDKLAALAGIASAMDTQAFAHRQNNSIQRYIAGLWNSSSFIEYELCWIPRRHPNGRQSFRPKEYRAPSWSWASVEGAIDYSYKRDFYATGDTRCGVVQSAKVETVDGGGYGPVTSGWIKVNGPLTEYQDVAYQQDDRSLPRPHPVYLLTMFALFCDQMVWGLALKKVESGPNEGCFERVGSFSFSDDYGEDSTGIYDKLYGAPEQTVTII